jgi:hypothetical protein
LLPNRFKGIGLDPIDTRALACGVRNFSRRNTDHALIRFRDCAPRRGGLRSRAGCRVHAFSGQDTRGRRRNSHGLRQAKGDSYPDGKTETETQRHDPAARTGHAQAARDGGTFARCHGKRNVDLDAPGARDRHADYDSLTESNTPANCEGYVHAEANTHANNQAASDGNGDVDPEADSHRHFDAEANRHGNLYAATECNRNFDSTADGNRHVDPEAFSKSDAQTKSDAQAESDTQAKSDADSQAITNSKTSANSGRVSCGR